MGESKNKLEAVRTKWNLWKPTGTLVSLITSIPDAVCDMQENRHPSPQSPRQDSENLKEQRGGERRKPETILAAAPHQPGSQPGKQSSSSTWPCTDAWLLLHFAFQISVRFFLRLTLTLRNHTRRRILRTQLWVRKVDREQAAAETNSWVCSLPRLCAL